MVGGVGAGAICSHLPGMTKRQREMCRSSPEAVLAVARGLRMGLSECQQQFASHRWNCSAVGRPDSFIHVVIVGSREAGFTYGVTSAGAAYSVAGACSRGEVGGCGCERRERLTPGAWKWGGCSVDLGYGLKVARRFLDAREIERDPRSLMNLHNNKAGRTAVKTSLVRDCKCHGVSGSCTMKTCWTRLPVFRVVGDKLMRKYWGARWAVVGPGGVLQLRRSPLPPRRADLVFLQPSPDYCRRDLSLGSPGTVGRLCHRTSTGRDGCEVLCCGRGYNTQEYVRKWQCNCKFHWCCEVKCETCAEATQRHTCN